jgi:aspartyl protease family protein
MGNAEIRNLDANISQYLDEVLIGMNTLKYFNMTQSGDTLTLVANNPSGNAAVSAPVLDQANNSIPIEALTSDKPIKKSITVKKSITCDEHKVCKTTYSDH